MNTLQLTKTDAIDIYKLSTDEGKELLEQKFGKEIFNSNISQLVPTFEAGLAFRNVTAADVLPIVPAFMKEHETRIQAVAKLFFLGDIYRNGWIPDYSNPNQVKYYAWEIYKSGAGLSLYVVVYGYSAASVASRLTFPDENTVRGFERNFRSIYNDYML